MNVNNSPINTLPDDILQYITYRLCFYEQAFTIPQVCKNWQRISLINDQRKIALNYLYEELTKGRSNKTEKCKFKQMTLLINNDVIHELKHLKLKFYTHKMIMRNMGIQNIVLNKKKSMRVADYHKHTNSDFFQVYWNPETFQLSTKKTSNQDHHILHYINVFKSHIVELNTNVEICLKYHMNIPSFHKKESWVWQKAITETSKIYEDHLLVIYALNFELENLISRLTETNLIFFSNIHTVDDLSTSLYNTCDKFGRIIKPNEVNYEKQETHKYNFTIVSKKFDFKIKKFLLWETDDFSDEDCTFEKALKWCVLSKTTEKLSIKIKLTFKTFYNP